MTATTGADLIAQERARQQDQEGYLPDHDDRHAAGELVDAALAYLLWTAGRLAPVYDDLADHQAEGVWPWHLDDFKPDPDLRRNLVRAGALIAAELDRYNRQAAHLAAGALEYAAAHHPLELVRVGDDLRMICGNAACAGWVDQLDLEQATASPAYQAEAYLADRAEQHHRAVAGLAPTGES